MKVGTLFTGIGGLDLAFVQAGYTLTWMCEIDPACQGVLARHFPEVPVHGDVRTFNGYGAAPVDLIAGGFPCQDVSIAGDRAGLAGDRSGLWFQFLRILRQHHPRWVVIENVPGLLSSNEGRDFATILYGLGQLRYRTAWRILDAQYFGVAQRRRRVFLVGYLGDGRAAEVLFESAGGGGDTPAGGQTGADLAATLGSGAGHRGWPSDIERMTFLPVANALTASAGHHGHSSPRGDGSDNLVVGSLAAHHGRLDDAQAQGGQLIVAGALRASHGGPDDNRAQAGQLVVSGPPAIAQSNRGRATGDAAETLRAGSHGALPMVATWDPRNVTSATNRSRVDFDAPANTLHADGMGVLAFTERGRADGRALEYQADLAYALLSPHGGGDSKKRQIAGDFGVRRLTPVECERLQGFPDGWTAEQADSARYKQLGNAVCVPVARWLADRILAAEGIMERCLEVLQ